MLKRLADKKNIGCITWVKKKFYNQANIYLKILATQK